VTPQDKKLDFPAHPEKTLRENGLNSRDLQAWYMDVHPKSA
jgi:hypothetical protein